ncbi:MAG: HAD family hydrolase [Erysipelotrichaceae bacterium]|nr:HAD family hydrolase [Erysipelotrichaceae bacterium]
MFGNIRVIAADIDGTLAPTAQIPSRYTIETIDELREKGYLFGLASGRPADDLLDKYQIWQARSQYDFIIGWNGCQLIDLNKDRHYEYNKLKKEWIREIIGFMDEFDTDIHMYLPGRYISSADSDRAWRSAYRTRREYIVCPDKEFFCQQDNCGIMFRYRFEDDERIQKKLKLLEGKEYIGFNTQKDLLEFSHKDSSKGYALKQYCDLYGIGLSEALSFGDSDNDNEMLKVSHGVCLKNGREETKRCAEYITERNCDEDGFARFIHEHLL